MNKRVGTAWSRWRSPPQLAEELGVDPSKIRCLIRSGELRANNLATRDGGRPRWRIAPEALVEFLQRRQASANMTLRSPRRKRKCKRKSENVTEYF